MSDVALLKWRSAVGECRIHQARLQAAVSRVNRLVPLGEEALDCLAEEDAAWIDQLLYRFSKLQTAMGERLFVNGLLLLGEDFRDRPFLDALNRLEALGLIRDRNWWQELRELRNQVAHEYPERRDEQAAAVNGILSRSPDLLETLEKFVATVELRLSELPPDRPSGDC